MRVPSPVGRIKFATPASTELAPDGWSAVQTMLSIWMARGCAQVLNREGILFDLTQLAVISPQELGGCEMVIFHGHVLMRFPPAVHRLTIEPGRE